MPRTQIASLPLSIGTSIRVRAPPYFTIGALGSSAAASKVWPTCPVSTAWSTVGAIPRLKIGALLMNSANCGGVLWRAARRNTSPSRSSIEPNVASQMRVAFSRIASNTGARSPRELLMTLSTSDVAVCRSNDSRNSLRSRVFSMAMTAWAAKFWTSAICLSVNGRTSWR